MRMIKPFRLRLLALLAAAVLLPVCGTFAEETERTEKEKGVPQVSLAAFFSLYFTTGSLPQGSSLAENSLRIDSLYPEKPVSGGDGEEEGAGAEKIISATVSRKSGKYYLARAVRVSVDGEGAELSLDPECMTRAGTAEVTLVLESEHYRYETDQTLTVADPAVVPLFAQTVFNPVFNITPGSSFTAQTLLGSIVTVQYPAYCKAKGLPYPDAEVKISETDSPALTRNEDTGVCTLEDYAVLELNLVLRIANLKWSLPFRIESEPYSITGPGFAMPGSTVRYRVTDQDAAAGRRYAWSAEGDGVTIDQKDGTLTVSADAKTDTYIKIRLTPDKDPAISTSVLVPQGALPKDLYVLHEQEAPKTKAENSEEPLPSIPLTEKEAGFSVAVPEGDNWRTTVSAKRQDGWIFRCITTGTGGATVVVDARTDVIRTGFREDDLAAMSWYNGNELPDTAKNLQSRDIRIDGHLAREYLFTMTDQNGQATHYGQISYCRNNQALTVRVFTTRQGTTAENLIPVTMKDLDRIVSGIRYEADGNTIRREDAQLTLKTKDGTDIVVVGKNLPLTAEFANTDLINRGKRNNGLRWEVRDAVTGEETELAEVNNSGVLKVKRGLEKVTQLEVTAVSEEFGTKATCMITACPVTQELKAEPEEIHWFKKTDNKPVTVKVTIEPVDILPGMLTWTAHDGTRLEITPAGDGTALLTCLGDGSNSVQVTAPDGRKAEIKIKSFEAVKSLALKISGNPKPGGNVACRTAFTPERDILKDVKWSLDVDAETAVIDDRGIIHIHPAAEPGTVITVKCEALGAPEPVVATEKFTVE